MKKNAFTLVELLSVIIILGIVLAIVTTSVFNVLESSKEDSYDTQVELLKSSAKEYVSDNKRSLFNEDNTICISISDLLMKKYIEKIPKDTRTGEKFSEFFGFVITKDGNQITYTVAEDIYSEELCKN